MVSTTGATQDRMVLALARACEALGCQIELKAKCMHMYKS